jgi:hypothetical protein
LAGIAGLVLLYGLKDERRFIAMKTVLFLGAGFSRAWGLPVMQEFFQHAKNSEYLGDNDKDFLRKLQRKARQGVSMLQIGNDNLEEVLSFSLASRNFNSGYPNQGDSEYDRLCHILQEVYRRIDLKKWFESDGLLDNLKRLFGTGVNRHLTTNELTIITTNYDVMIEFMLSKFGWHCYLPGEWSVVEGKKHPVADKMCSSNKSQPLLCKLHGSLNWCLDPDDQTKFLVENSILYTDYLDDMRKHKGVYLPEVSFRNYEPIRTPLIVPPTLFKMQTIPTFREIWNVAGKALEEAEKLVFIGFSFQESDTYIQYFLAANLYENIDLRPIEIVDPKADEIYERLKKGKLGIHFRDLLKPINGKWEDIDYSVI